MPETEYVAADETTGEKLRRKAKSISTVERTTKKRKRAVYLMTESFYLARQGERFREVWCCRVVDERSECSD